MVTELSNCTVVQQRAMILSLSLSLSLLFPSLSQSVKTSEAGESQQAQMCAVQGGSFAPH
jgi:hypothetical protein